jgi:6,7-dimethyl-8-ribityllumazine synthase
MSLKVNKLKKKQIRKYAIVVADFHPIIAERLLQGCLGEFSKQGVGQKNITIVHVPGAFEIPVAALCLARKKDICAVVCLGAIIRGETLHYDLVAQQAAAGIMQVSLTTEKPVIFGVLATDTLEQVNQRSQQKGDNRGADAAAVAVKMASIL